MIHVSVYDLAKIEARLGNMKHKARIVVSRSLNRAAANARTNLVRQAREEYFIKASDVRSTITISDASRDSLRVILKSRGTKRELAAFKINPTAPRPKKPPAVLRVAVKRAGGYKPFPGAFLVRGTSAGVVHVTTRVGKERHPIQTKYGLAVPQMIGSNLSRREYRSHLEKEAYGMFLKRLDHEVGQILGGI